MAAKASVVYRFLRWRDRNRRTLIAYAILTPIMIYLVIFLWLPLVSLFALSFTQWNIVHWPPKFVALQNYRRLITDRFYVNTLINTFKLGTSMLFINVVLGFAVAVLLNGPVRGRVIFRTLWYLPTVLSGAVMAQVVLVFLYPSEYGVVNLLLGKLLGIKPILWVLSPTWMPMWVVLFASWRSVGWVVVFYLAGLQAIDPALYEAARMDGANRLQLLWHITIPAMAPVFIFVTVTGLVGALQMWEAPLVLTKGGPQNSTMTLVYVMYDDAFNNTMVGMGTAEAATLLLILIVCIGLQLRFYRRYYLE